MTLESGNIYTSSIPEPQSIGDVFRYYIQAIDAAGNTNTSAIFSFSVAYPLIAALPNPLTITLAHPGDIIAWMAITNSGNAELSWQLRTNWFDRVREDDNGWTHSGANDLWHTSQSEAHSGDFSWYCGNERDESYDNATDAGLVTPEVTLGETPRLAFYQWFMAEYDGRAGYEDYYWDGGVVDISTNGGTTFTRIVPVGGYPYKITPNDDSPFPADTPCLAGTGGWEKVEFDLAAYAGKRIRIRFRFGSDHYTVARGWFIDDICLSWQPGWLLPQQENGTVIPSAADSLELALQAATLAPGSHSSSLTLISNDPVNPALNIPAELLILAEDIQAEIRSTSQYQDGFVISWPSDSLHTYRVMMTTNLIDNLWSPVPECDGIPGIDDFMNYTGTIHSGSSKFYRIDEQNR